jgi:hypothetical protein
MKVQPVGAELFHEDGWMDGRTDKTKLIVAFPNFANTPRTYHGLTKIVERSQIRTQN